MTIAVLIRGFHFLERDRFGFPLDGRRWLESFDARIFRPLKKQHDVSVFLATYPSPIEKEIVQRLQPAAAEMLDSRKSNQLGTYLAGLDLIGRQQKPFDRIIATRFDLKYLAPADSWNIWERRGIFLPWKEYEILWNDHHRVGDAVHLVDSSHLSVFRAGLEALQTAGSTEMHKLYDALKPMTDDLHFLADGFYDSNTLFCNHECRNPIYRIANRPRLPIFKPYRPNLEKPGFGFGLLVRHRLRQLHYAIASGLISITATFSRGKHRLLAGG